MNDRIQSTSVSAKSREYYSRSRPEILPHVPFDVRTVLDCGCGEGSLGEALRNRGCQVTGIEIHAGAAEVARSKLDRLLLGPLEERLADLADESFDCIICADILEHLVDPWTVLAGLSARLRPGGTLICSIPNIRHFGVLLNVIVRGRWRYTTSGILDATHLRFFAKQDAVAMIKEAGLVIESVTGNADDFKGFSLIGSWAASLLIPDLRVAQWIVRARKPIT